MHKSLSKVSIVIVTYMGDKLLGNCLESIKRTCANAPEIIVVDNSPSPSTKEITQRFTNATYIESHGNPGFAGGNNRAIPYCGREYILFLNNDTIIHSADSIIELVAFMEARRDCAAAQGSGLLPRCQNTLGGCGSFITPAGLLKTVGFLTKDNPRENKSRKCFCVSGFFMMLRRNALSSVGGRPFRTHYWCYYEEVDLCHRLWNAGHEVWYVKTPPIDHLLSITAGTFKRTVIMKRYLRNIVFSHFVNFSFAGRILVLPAFYALLMTHALFCLIRGRPGEAQNDIFALLTPLREHKRILAARRQTSRQRKRSDLSVFKTVMKPYSLKDFISKIY